MNEKRVGRLTPANPCTGKLTEVRYIIAPYCNVVNSILLESRFGNLITLSIEIRFPLSKLLFSLAIPAFLQNDFGPILIKFPFLLDLLLFLQICCNHTTKKCAGLRDKAFWSGKDPTLLNQSLTIETEVTDACLYHTYGL